MKHKWRVIRTIRPYPEGYGTYNRHVLLDTGLSREEATEICKELNNKSAKEKVHE